MVTTRRKSEGASKAAGDSKNRKDIGKGAVWDSKFTWNVADDEVGHLAAQSGVVTRWLAQHISVRTDPSVTD